MHVNNRHQDRPYFNIPKCYNIGAYRNWSQNAYGTRWSLLRRQHFGATSEGCGGRSSCRPGPFVDLVFDVFVFFFFLRGVLGGLLLLFFLVMFLLRLMFFVVCWFPFPSFFEGILVAHTLCVCDRWSCQWWPDDKQQYVLRKITFCSFAKLFQPKPNKKRKEQLV